MAEWVMDALTGNRMRRGSSSANHVVKGDVDTFARETGQNAKDQRLNENAPVKLRYTLIELSGKHKEAFLAAMDWKGLRSHLEACVNDPGETGPRLRRGMEAVDSDKPLRCLRVEDYDTRGLEGEEFEEDKNFCLLCRAEFKTSNVAGRGGSYGLGKAVLWKLSSIGTVLLASTVHGSEKKGIRIFGRTDIPSHSIGGKSFESGGWFGSKNVNSEDNSSFAASIFGDGALAQKLHLDRAFLKSSGTSALVIGFFVPDDEEVRSLEEIAKDILAGTARWFWPSMSGPTPTMEVHVTIERDGKEVFSQKADPLPDWEPFIEARQKLITGQSAKTPHDVAESSIPFKVPARDLPRDKAHRELETALTLRVTRGDDSADNHTKANSVAVFRGAEMVVKYLESKRKPLDGRPFFGVLFAGKARGKSIEDERVEEFFRASEPPLHDDWEYSEGVKHAYKTGAKRRLAELWASIPDKVFALIDENVVPEERGPELLSKLFPFGQSGSKGRKRLVQTQITGSSYLGGRWKIEGRVTRVQESTKTWDARLGFVTGTDSGSGEYLTISNLTLSDKRAKPVSLGPPAIVSCHPALDSFNFEVTLDPPVALTKRDLDLTAIKFSG